MAAQIPKRENANAQNALQAGSEVLGAGMKCLCPEPLGGFLAAPASVGKRIRTARILPAGAVAEGRAVRVCEHQGRSAWLSPWQERDREARA